MFYLCCSATRFRGTFVHMVAYSTQTDRREAEITRVTTPRIAGYPQSRKFTGLASADVDIVRTIGSDARAHYSLSPRLRITAFTFKRQIAGPSS